MKGYDPTMPAGRMTDARLAQLGRDGWEGHEYELYVEVHALKADLAEAQALLSSAGGEMARSLLSELKLPDVGPSIAGSNPFDVTITVDLARRIRAVLHAAERKDKRT